MTYRGWRIKGPEASHVGEDVEPPGWGCRLDWPLGKEPGRL